MKANKDLMYSGSMKDCKNSTPDGKLVRKVPVRVKECKSRVFDIKLSGDFVFDSYDKSDGSCYISKKYNDGMTYNVLLTDIEIIKKEK